MRRFLPLLILAACGPTWSMSVPFILSVDSPEVPADAARAAFASAIGQLGGQVGQGGQTVHIAWDSACDCRSCQAHTAAYTDYHGDTIHLCPWYLMEPPDGLAANITHELGHVLGFADHLPCATGAVMAPTYNCERDKLHYQPADIAAICGAGAVSGGACA